MPTLEDLLSQHGDTVLQHDAPYDPAKAHEYYLRYRKLHPRAAGPGKGTFTVNEGHGKHVKLSAKQLAEQKVYAAHRTAQIKDKLNILNAELRKKVQAAAKSAENAKKPPTAKEKAAAAKASKEYAAKHKTEIANKAKASSSKAAATPKKKSETVDSLKKEIVTTKASLKAAVAKQRELATAKKNG